MQLRLPFSCSVRLPMNQIQAACLAQNGLLVNMFRAETANAFHAELQKSGICIQLACDGCVAPRGMASREGLAFEDQAFGHARPCQRGCSRGTGEAGADYDYVNFRRSTATPCHDLKYIQRTKQQTGHVIAKRIDEPRRRLSGFLRRKRYGSLLTSSSRWFLKSAASLATPSAPISSMPRSSPSE